MPKFIFNEWDLKHKNIATPTNFVENAKLSNYRYVKFYRDGVNLIIEMKCICKDNIERVFFYTFDERDFLQKIISVEENKNKTLFDRKVELRRLNNDKKYFARKDNKINK